MRTESHPKASLLVSDSHWLIVCLFTPAKGLACEGVIRSKGTTVIPNVRPEAVYGSVV